MSYFPLMMFHSLWLETVLLIFVNEIKYIKGLAQGLKSESISHSVVSNSFQPHGLLLAWFLCPWDSPGKNTRVSSYSLLRGIILIQGSNPGLLHCRQILYCLSHEGSPIRSLLPSKYSTEVILWTSLTTSDTVPRAWHLLNKWVLIENVAILRDQETHKRGKSYWERANVCGRVWC